MVLVAIVGLRVEVLKLGSGVGRELQEATALESSNQILRSQVSALSDNQRIIQKATQMGMVMAGPTAVHFVRAAVGTHVSAAIANIHQPSTDTFLSSIASERQADAASPAATETATAGDTSVADTAAADSGSSESSSTGAIATGDGSTPSTDSGAATGDTSTASTVAAPSVASSATSDASAADTVPPAATGTATPPATTQSAGTAVAPTTAGATGTATGSTTGGSGLAG